jgi:HAD superfamily hydrolase (TIGR01509 family)
MFSIFKKSIKLICFDVDNTLCDSNSAEAETESIMMEFLAKKISEMQQKNNKINSNCKSNSKNNNCDVCSAFTIMTIFNEFKHSHLHHDLEPEKYSRALWFKETLEKLDETKNLGISVNKLLLDVDSYEKRYWDNYSRLLKNYPNAIFTLKYLKSMGFKLAIVSDSDGKKEIKTERLKKLGLDKYFNYIVISDDTGFNKPDIRNWESVLKISGFSSKECVMIGDHPDVDLVNAKKLGFVTIWTKEGLNTTLHHKYVDYEIRDIKDTIDILSKISKIPSIKK